MSIFQPDFETIGEADIQQLVTDGQTEGLSVEFKRDMYGNSDSDKKEFLKDLSSFANSAGGQLIIGVDEAQGAASSICPLTVDADATLLRLEQIAQSAIEPRIVGVRMRAIPISGGGFVFMARVPRSWNPPHRVSYQNTNRFYLRSSAGAHEASVEELRAIFANGAGMRDRMSAYVRDRLGKISQGAGVVPLAEGQGAEGKLVIHIMPFATFTGSPQIDVGAAQSIADRLQPLGASGSSQINFDGFMVVRTGDPSHGYTQLFREGIIEATKVRTIAQNNQFGRLVPMRRFVEPIYQRIPQYIGALSDLGVPPPYAISISVLDVQGAYLGIGNGLGDFDDQRAIDRPNLGLPIQIITDNGSAADYRNALTPALDSLFNAVGIESAEEFLQNYNAEGVWVGA
ncbi:ATP-binding protein [Rhizobium sp.]|uniref:AlbA family DNA-binding domain-containing protein n=1 Tax=Rhizobium sp. TaxID=391 RepID=UPI0028B2500C